MPKISALDAKTGTITLFPGVQGTTTVKLTPAQLQAQFGLFTSSAGTRAAAVSASVDSSIQWLQTEGYAAIGDGGGGLYKKVVSAPAHSGYFQSTDGAYWELQGPVVTLENFGAKGDGTTDDTTAVINAFSSHIVIGAKLLGRSGKTYKIVGAGPAMAFEGVNFDGQDCAFDLRTGPVSGYVFTFSQQATHRTTTISANAAIGDDSITLASVASIVAGDWLEFAVTLASTSNTYGFVAPVTAIVGSVVSIATSVPIAINSATDGNSVNAVLPSRGTFRNAKFIGTSIANSATAIIFNYCAGTVENLRFLDCRGDLSNGGGIFINFCFDLSVRNISLQNSGTAGKADFTAISSNCNYTGINSDRAYGFGLQWAQGCFNNVTNVVSAKASGRGVKLGAQVLSAFSNINVQQASENGFAATGGTQRCTFSNIIAVNTTGVVLNQHGIWLSDQTNTDNVFVNFKALNNVDADIFVGASDTGCHFSNGSYGTFTNSGLATLNNVNGVSGGNHADVTLANGDNNNVALVAARNFWRVAGPTGGFAITGIVAGIDNQRLTIFNAAGQVLTIKNQSGSSTGGNKIFTCTGADVVTGTFSVVDLVYDLTTTQWVITGRQN